MKKLLKKFFSSNPFYYHLSSLYIYILIIYSNFYILMYSFKLLYFYFISLYKHIMMFLSSFLKFIIIFFNLRMLISFFSSFDDVILITFFVIWLYYDTIIVLIHINFTHILISLIINYYSYMIIS